MNLTPETIKQTVEKAVPFVERMGLKAYELRPGRVRLGAPLKGNENHIGSIYAGALFTLAEMPVGALFLTTFDASKYYPIVKEVTIKFVRLARSDVSIEMVLSEEETERIRTEAAQNGKSEFTLEGEIKDESGVVVAVSRGIFQIRAVGR